MELRGEKRKSKGRKNGRKLKKEIGGIGLSVFCLFTRVTINQSVTISPIYGFSSNAMIRYLGYFIYSGWQLEYLV